MRFELHIECDNAAFCDDDGDPMPENEVGRLLKELSKDVGQLGVGAAYRIWDINGNMVGSARFIEE